MSMPVFLLLKRLSGSIQQMCSLKATCTKHPRKNANDTLHREPPGKKTMDASHNTLNVPQNMRANTAQCQKLQSLINQCSVVKNP